MKALLFSMPDVGPLFHPRVWRAPNLGISSLAASAAGHDVVCADLIVRRENVREAVDEAMEQTQPDLVGLGAMSFQFHTALCVAEQVKAAHPDMPIVLGGYHATLLADEVAQSPRSNAVIDYLIRGEGETPFKMFLDALDAGTDLARVPGLSWKRDGTWVHNERGPLEDLKTLPLPDRSSRLWNGEYFMRGVQQGNPLKMLVTMGAKLPMDVIETSRGCTMQCTFCSIRQMYGSVYRAFDVDRVMADIADSKRFGTKWAVLADDNITLDAERYERLCDAIVANGHHDVSYIVQASSIGCSSSERLVRKMDKANMRIAFLGMENVSKKNLLHIKKGDILERTRTAIRYLHKYGILIVGGMIAGLPDDDVADLEENFDFLVDEAVDFYGTQIAQPYPATEMRQELLDAGLVTNPDDYRRYDGAWANVRTKHLTSDELQFWCWKLRRDRSDRYDVTPTIKRVYPLWGYVRQYLYKPIKRLRRAWNNRHMTERQVFEAEMARRRKLNDFYGDEP